MLQLRVFLFHQLRYIVCGCANPLRLRINEPSASDPMCATAMQRQLARVVNENDSALNWKPTLRRGNLGPSKTTLCPHIGIDESYWCVALLSVRAGHPLVFGHGCETTLVLIKSVGFSCLWLKRRGVHEKCVWKWCELRIIINSWSPARRIRFGCHRAQLETYPSSLSKVS